MPSALWTALTREVAAFPGALAENKRFSFVVHYQLAPAAERPLRQAVTRLIASSPIAIEAMDARCAIELKAPGHDKGRAIAAFLSQPVFGGRAPVFVGDDATDESGLRRRRRRRRPRLFGRQPAAGRDRRLPDPRAVRDWLAEFADRRNRA